MLYMATKFDLSTAWHKDNSAISFFGQNTCISVAAVISKMEITE